MQYKTLGKTGLSVSRIGFGCIKFKEETQKDVSEAMNLALDEGINFFDTARAYGPSEIMIGKAIAKRRDEFYIATKTKKTSYKEAKNEIELSLRNLQTDYIDLYQLHSVSTPERWEEAISSRDGSLRAMIEAKEAGKIGHIGITIHRSLENMRRAIEHGIFETLMVLYNVVDEENVESEILPLAARNEIGTIIMKALGGGRFTGLPDSIAGHGERNLIAERCLRFVLANTHVDTVIPGMRNAREVAENVATEALPELAKREHRELLTALKQGLGNFRYEQKCMQCGYCMPCPEGISIPRIMRAIAYFKSERIPNGEAARVASMVDVGPENCRDCGECVESCPAALNIPNILRDERDTFNAILSEQPSQPE